MIDLEIISLNNENIDQFGCYCLRNKKQKGYSKKIEWLREQFQEGLKVKILHTDEEGDIGFIEYVTGENSWRGFADQNYMFIHCIYIAKKNHRNCGYGKLLIDECIKDAKAEKKKGVVAIASGGAMLAEKEIYLQNGFTVSDTQSPKYQLLVKSFTDDALPKFEEDKQSSLEKYNGLHLLYADQCPYLIKSVDAIKKVAKEYGLTLNISEIQSAKEAQQAPSFYGVFCLIYNGELLAEHYISEKRFTNILEKQLKLKKVTQN